MYTSKDTLNEQIINLLLEMGWSLRREISESTRSMGHLTILQVHILVYLSKSKKNNNSEVAKFFHITKSTASLHLKKLEDLRLIGRTQNHSDRRIDWIVLTKKGEKAVNKKINENRKKANKLLSLVPENEKKQLLTIIKSVSKIFEQTYETK